jgi:hypothetical protein
MGQGQERRKKEIGNPVVVLLLSQRLDWFERQRIWRRMPGSTLIHENVQFTLNPLVPSDITVVLNNLPYDLPAITNKNNIWRWDLESSGPKQRHHSFTKIFSCWDSGPNSQFSPPILDWWIDKTFDELAQMTKPKKDRDLSCIASTKQGGSHLVRFEFVNMLEDSDITVDIFGRGRSLELKDKWDGLGRYFFSVALENRQMPHYWTEKLADPILSFCVPFYWGAPNLHRYLPKESFIWLPIDDPKRAMSILREECHPANYTARFEALVEARNRLLFDYSLWARICNHVEEQRITPIRTLRRKTKILGLRRRRRIRWR